MKARKRAFPMAAMATAAGLLMGQVGVACAEGGTIRFEGAIVAPTCDMVPRAGARPTLQSRCPSRAVPLCGPWRCRGPGRASPWVPITSMSGRPMARAPLPVFPLAMS